MKLEVCHTFLARGNDLEAARAHTLRFLENTKLVHYQTVRVVTPECRSASDPKFWETVAECEAGNRQAMAKLLAELKAAGVNSLENLLDLDQGYESKVLHTIAHLLDGFFGVDSEFYNLPEDAHWLSEQLRDEIKAEPSSFWLVKVAATLTALENKAVVALRTFEK